jgi:hypothetical protein
MRLPPSFAPWLWLPVLYACAPEPVERAPLASDRCGGEICTMPPRMGIGGSALPADAGPAVVSDAGGAAVSLEVQLATRADGSELGPLGSERIDVVVDAANGVRTEFTYDGGEQEVSLAGPAPYWFRLRPEAAELITTLLPVARVSSNLVLPLFDRRVFEDVADNLAIPVALASDRGHAVMLFTRGGLPLSGVSVAVADGRVAYDAGTLFSDGVEVTQERGAAALLNLPAVTFPGGSSEVQVTVDGETSLVEIELSRDAVTLVTMSL